MAGRVSEAGSDRGNRRWFLCERSADGETVTAPLPQATSGHYQQGYTALLLHYKHRPCDLLSRLLSICLTSVKRATHTLAPG